MRIIRIGMTSKAKAKSILDVVKVIQLRFRKTIVHGIAVVKSGVNKTCANGPSRIKVRADAMKITNVIECTTNRRDVINEGKMVQK